MLSVNSNQNECLSADERDRCSEFAAAANNAHENFERFAGAALDHAHAAGDALLQAKASLPHGQFELWLTENVQFSARTARQYMRVAENWLKITEHRTKNPNLSLRDAIGLLTEQVADLPEKTQQEIARALPSQMSSVAKAKIKAHESGEKPRDMRTTFNPEELEGDRQLAVVPDKTPKKKDPEKLKVEIDRSLDKCVGLLDQVRQALIDMIKAADSLQQIEPFKAHRSIEAGYRVVASAASDVHARAVKLRQTWKSRD